MFNGITSIYFNGNKYITKRVDKMAEEELKLETKCYDANEYGYLYGLNQKIPDEEFEKVKPYFRKFKRMDFVEGNVQVTGRPEGWRCLEKDVPKVEEILGITNTLEKRQNKVKEAFADPIKKSNLQEHAPNRTCQGLQFTQQRYTTLVTATRKVPMTVRGNCSSTLHMECGTSSTTPMNLQTNH